jgi:choline dehydrogenase-like flavoprotein
MILEARELEPGAALAADLCIVGAGAAGIAMALAFADSKLRVVVLESGGLSAEPASQALYEGSVAPGSLHPPPERFRRRQFGGSTSLWGGRCAPFDPIDFEARDWVPHSGWPIAYEEVARFYPAASRLCEIGDFDFTARPDWPELLEGFVGADFSTTGLERFSCPNDFGARYRGRLEASAQVRVILHANVVAFQLAADGMAVEQVTARTLGGGGFTVRATHFVLAAGGLEVARILLEAARAHPGRFGGACLGRYYMCHLAGTVGRLSPKVRVRHGYHVTPEGIYARRRLALREAAQRRLRCGNFIARLHHPDISDASHGSGALSALWFAAPFVTPEYATRLRGDGGRWVAHVRNLLGAPWATGAFLMHCLRERILAERKFPSIVVASPCGRFTLDVHAEQYPNPASQVRLADDTDALGVRRLVVDWRYLPEDVRSVRIALSALAADLAGVAEFSFDEPALEHVLLRDGAYGGHHLGTARMSADPRAGVVDAECRVHGLANLWVAGGAVFPTSSQANPTLTVVALALRLAERLGAADGRLFFFEKKNQKTLASAVAGLSG